MRVRLAATLALAALTCSCGEAGVYYDVKFAPGFSEGPTTVSVLGVYQDGRMSNEMWGEINAKLAPVLGQPSCDIVWGDDLRTSNPDLFEQVDRITQSDGITEDMLDRFSGGAQGDAIMVVSLHIKRGGQPVTTTSSNSGYGLGMGGANRGMGPMPGSRGRTAPPPPPGAIRPNTWAGQEIRLAATLFSAKRHAAMGRIILTYLGTNLDDAMKRFAKKVGETIPGSVCKGWKVDGVK